MRRAKTRSLVRGTAALIPLAERREEDDVADRLSAGQEHREPVDAQSQSAGRRAPPPASARWSSKRAACSSASFISVNAFPSSTPPAKYSKRSTIRGSS